MSVSELSTTGPLLCPPQSCVPVASITSTSGAVVGGEHESVGLQAASTASHRVVRLEGHAVEVEVRAAVRGERVAGAAAEAARSAVGADATSTRCAVDVIAEHALAVAAVFVAEPRAALLVVDLAGVRLPR